ncbi:uncharacterized protein LOC104851043 isoform X1 [Fukomys damarensis]|uniref:uncharacterized protein LOC104851043 isoform X1 n=1 Tax=Fukomys damarensis TaxID=885580 RepID=UPI00053F4B41|nr:uncharacterized protein LOC104851043 isoform X1 [Fukomys damarensis]XP_010606503.1 uncharacterized protein LOC104851043 isoform X1 [Fukomys damarensis]
MPRVKEGKGKSKGAPPPIAPVLQQFLKTYEKHCAHSQTSMCPAIRRDLKSSIDSEQSLRRFTLIRPADSLPGLPPVSLEPLLMTIRDERYTPGKEICIWGLQLSNPEIARLSCLLELTGRTACPFTTLEIIACKMDPWSLGRLGKALQFSSLLSLVLDYCRFGNEEMECIFSGLENNKRLQGLSLRYCGLGPWSGPRLGSIISRSAVCKLHLDGNSLQCSGALALLRPLVEYAEMQGKDPPGTASPDTGNSPQLLHKIRNKKRLTEAGPWLVKLQLADNGIDGKGEEGENLLEFTRMLTCLIKYSAHLREIDLGNNDLGETAAADVLGALRARKTGKLPGLKIRVTPQISSDTFRSIWKNSKKSKTTYKKKKKAKN